MEGGSRYCGLIFDGLFLSGILRPRGIFLGGFGICGLGFFGNWESGLVGTLI